MQSFYARRDRFVATLFCVMAVAATGTSAFGQRGDSSKYSKGDRVEVDAFGWKKGTVVAIDSHNGWVEVRIDESEDEHARNFPKNMRATILTQLYPPDRVRPLAEAEATATRTWTDITGKFRVKAQFGGVDGDNVILIRAGGKQVKVPIAKLSEKDRQYVKAQSEAGENPFGEPDPAEVAAVAKKKANWDGVREVRPNSFERWRFTPSGTTPAAADGGNLKVRLADIPDSQKFFEDIEGIYASRDGNRVIVCRNRGSVSQNKELYVQEVDATKARAMPLVALPETTAVLDVEPDAGLVMYRPDNFGSGENGLLTIARLEGDSLVPVLAWEPYSDEDFPPRRDVEKAHFLSADRVMTINGHGKALTVWDTNSAKAIFNIPVGFSSALKLALSPDRTLLAVVMGKGVAIIDVAKGQHVATIETPGHDIRQVEFRDDNSRLAAAQGHCISVWDLTNGNELTSFAAMGTGSNTSLAWAGEFLLVESRCLYDVERRILLWEYEGDPHSAAAATMRNGRLYAIPRTRDDGDETNLLAASVPHRSAREMAAKLPSAEELLVVRPGDGVQLEVDIDPGVVLTDEAQKQLTAMLQNVNLENADAGDVVVLQPGSVQGDLIKQALTVALAEAGLKVVEKSNLVVKAICKPQPQQTIRVNMDGRWPPRPQDIEERTITPHASYLEMTLDGELLWKRGFVAQPHMTIWMERGETLDQALQRLTQPNFTIFTQAVFSPYVARPGKATPDGAYGVSHFTARGIVDGSASGSGRTVGASFE